MTTGTYERIGIAGSGAIASGLAACASITSDVVVLGRSADSCDRCLEQARKAAAKVEGAEPGRISTSTETDVLGGAGLIVESVVEDMAVKAELLPRLAAGAPDADLASTTSSLSVAGLAEASGAPERFFALHVFNPVTRMELVEMCFTERTSAETRDRALAWTEAIGKRPIEVPDLPGFVVNRLLFPYLFDAVTFLEESGMEAKAVDECMTMGAGLPMGPLALIDFIGVDVSVAIGDELHAASDEGHRAPPERLRQMEAAGDLGRKSGRGFYEY